MRKLIQFFIDNELFGDLLTLAVIIIGIVTLMTMRRETFPNINFDIISVVTQLPGASPQEVEKLVTNPLERELKEVDGIKKLFSGSVEGRSGIVIYLDPDQTTAAEAKTDVQDVVDRSTELPEDAEKPIVTEIQTKQGPLIEVSLGGEIDPFELRAIAKSFEKELELIPGVAKVVPRGMRDLEIRVEVSQAKLSQFRLSLEDVIAALKKQNVSVPGGSIEADSGGKDGSAANGVHASASGVERLVRTIGDFKTLEDVKKTVIRANDLGQSIRVGDVANVFDSMEKATVLNRTNGVDAINLTVLRKEKADAIDLVDLVKSRVTELQGTFNPKLKVSYVNDLSTYVRRRLGILTGNLSIGLCLVLFLLPLMLPLRYSLIVALGEPFAFLAALIGLHWAGESINLLSMIGLIIVSGILVDDSIVVTENAVRMVEEEGKDPKEGALEGTLQVFKSITASVAITGTVFASLMFMTGIFGKFVRQIPISILACIGASLFECYFILPAHVAHWVKAKGASKNHQPEKRAAPIARFLNFTRTTWDNWLVPRYLKVLEVTLKYRYWTATALFGLFVGTLLHVRFVMPFILFPPDGIEIFMIRAQAPTGTSIERTAELIRPIEQAVSQLPKEELENFTTSVGIQQQDPNDPATVRGSEYAQITIFLTPETDRKRYASDIIESLRAQVGTPTGLQQVTFKRVTGGPPTGKPVSLGVRGREYKDILLAAQSLKELMATIPGITDITDSYILGKEEFQVYVNPEEAAAARLSAAAVGTAVRASFEGLTATTIRELDEEIDVRVSLPRSEREREKTLGDILIPNEMGSLIPLSRVARIERDQSLAVYEHQANQREVKVLAEVDTKISTATKANNDIREKLPELRRKHPGITVDFGGEDEDTRESLASYGKVFLIAICCVFLILILTFKSILQPLLILLTVPLGFISVVWTFTLHRMPLSFMGLLGMFALAAVIMNNAIVFIDFVNERRKLGVGKLESIMDAAKTRVRPIFLTTVTTVVGVLPTAYGIGGLDKFVVPIVMALGWGLFFGSILTAIVFPSSLSILDDIKAFMKRKVLRQS